jgi:hypothetical protein
MASDPTKVISKAKRDEAALSYIVPATGDDFFCSDTDLAAARKNRDEDVVFRCPVSGNVHVNGYASGCTKEGLDDHMLSQLMCYLASKRIAPTKGPHCAAFAHTSRLNPVVKEVVPRNTVVGGVAWALAFAEEKLLKEILSEEAERRGFLASFGQAHVRKRLRVAEDKGFSPIDVESAPGCARKVFSVYTVTLEVLTGFGVLQAQGELKLRDAIAQGKKSYPESHINWRRWGFDRRKTWEDPFS